MLLEKEYNDLGHEPDNVYSSNSNDEHSTHDFNTSFTRDVSEDNDSKDTDVPSNNPSKSEDELSDKEELADEYFQDKPALEKPSESYRNFKEKRHRSLNTHEMLHPPAHQRRDGQGSLYDRRRQFPYNFAPVQNMHHNYSNCRLAIYNNTSRYDKKYVSNRIRRDFQDLESDNESLHNELQILGDACENIYNIENRSRSRRVHGDRYKGPSNKESYRVSSHFDHNQPRINNYLIYYLKEEAIKESERLRNLIYESKSFSPDANKVKFIKKIKKDKDELLKLKKKTKSTKRKKKNKPIELEESDTVAERTTEEMEISENIESFTDFSDSMFTFKIKDKIKIYKCPYLGCLKELPSLSRIKRHYLVHTNLKPFKCLNSSCNKRFSRKDNMLQHFRTHCGSKKKKHSF